jgi:hypothetical protein
LYASASARLSVPSTTVKVGEVTTPEDTIMPSDGSSAAPLRERMSA